MPRRSGSASDQNVLSPQDVDFFHTFDFDGVRIDKAPQTGENLNAIAAELVAHHPSFALYDLRDAAGQVANRNLRLHRIVAAVKRPVAETGQVQDRFPQRLAGHRAAVDAHSS